ncbi:GTP 3',8-cyclase MoaA [soil metagenome]
MAELTDTYGRVHRDLRISITDRCNFRCTYCMPAEGMQWLPREELLTFEEIERVAGLLVTRYGFDGIRLTGGEPTVRARLPVLVERLARLRVDRGDAEEERVDLALTNNGATLALVADDLVAAGLRRINISCDTLRRDRFEAVTRRDRLGAVLDGIDVAVAAGLSPVKVNVVLVRGVNDDEIVDFATFARDRGVIVRFIEFMPLDADGRWQADQVVSRAEVLTAVGAVYPLVAVEGTGGPERPGAGGARAGSTGSQPAERFRFADGRGEIGVIPSVTHAFCGDCDRVRLTADGQLRNCLFATEEFDLRAVLRTGGTDDDLAAVVERAVTAKGPGHAIGQAHFIRPRRSMSQIGG